MLKLSIIFHHGPVVVLGMLAINDFLACLPQDDMGSFDVVQVMTEEMREKIIKMPTTEQEGFNREFKERFLKAVDGAKVGDKFLLVDDWLTESSNDNIRGLYYRLVINLLNDPEKPRTLGEAKTEAEKRILDNTSQKKEKNGDERQENL